MGELMHKEWKTTTGWMQELILNGRRAVEKISFTLVFIIYITE